MAQKQNQFKAVPFSEKEQAYGEFLKTSPGASYAQYFAKKTAEQIRNGALHATLGPKLNKFPNFWDAGERAFARYQRLFTIDKTNRVVDYGCGSLRIGGHFIRFLAPEHYFGLDVTNEYFQMGLDNIGPQLIRSQRPWLEVISEDSLEQAAEFGADLVFSSAVCYHVHPNELEEYFANLLLLTGKPGATLFFDASIAETPVFTKTLAWPMETYLSALSDLEFVKWHKTADRDVDGKKFTIGIFEFRRAE